MLISKYHNEMQYLKSSWNHRDALTFCWLWLQFLPAAIVSISSASSKDFRSGTRWSVFLMMLALPIPASSCISSCFSGLSWALQMLCSSAWEAYSSGTSCEPVTGQHLPFSQRLQQVFAISLDNSLFYSSLFLAGLMTKPVFKMHSFQDLNRAMVCHLSSIWVFLFHSGDTAESPLGLKLAIYLSNPWSL